MNNSKQFDGDGPSKIYQDALAEGKFIIQQCRDCGAHIFYPRALCHHCGSTDLSWVPASGRGTVYSTSVVRRKPERGPNYNVALIDLEEGPRMMSRVVDLEPEDVQIGMQVSAHVGTIDGEPAVVFSSKEQGVKEW